MGTYYNKKRGPIAVTLLNGDTLLFQPRKWTKVDPKLDSSALLQFHVRKGSLHRAPIRTITPVKAEKVVVTKKEEESKVAPKKTETVKKSAAKKEAPKKVTRRRRRKKAPDVKVVETLEESKVLEGTL